MRGWEGAERTTAPSKSAWQIIGTVGGRKELEGGEGEEEELGEDPGACVGDTGGRGRRRRAWR